MLKGLLSDRGRILLLAACEVDSITSLFSPNFYLILFHLSLILSRDSFSPFSILLAAGL